MLTVPKLAAEALGAHLAEDIARRFGSTDARLTELIPLVARVALECIGTSDALYHNAEHTMLVTLAGYDIMKGRALLVPTYPSDFAHAIVACLLHDIGYVRGILKGDGPDGYITGASDAALTPYHVDRSKQYALERLSNAKRLDAARIVQAIEYTRFPSATLVDDHNNEEGSLVRAADLIGQLGDPNYLRKANALYYEFEEIGMNRQLGYSSPADLTELYPQFYRKCVSGHIQTAIRYLNVTSSVRQWIANLYSNVFRAERDCSLCGPQR